MDASTTAAAHGRVSAARTMRGPVLPPDLISEPDQKRAVETKCQLQPECWELLRSRTFASTVLGADDFPLVGTYTENQVCKADSSDSGVPRVKITVRRHRFAALVCAPS